MPTERNASTMNIRSEIERRLRVLSGLELSGVNRAADMLTLVFGPLHPVINFKGALKYVGEWALHVQCMWRLNEAGGVVATSDDLRGSDENACATAGRLQAMLLECGPVFVEAVSVGEGAGVTLSLSRGFRLIVTPDRVGDDEDWRFFSLHERAVHLVIEGGKIASCMEEGRVRKSGQTIAR